MNIKKRLDILLAEKALAESREKAKALIMAGCVYVNNQKADKPGATYNENVAIEIRDKVCPFVSRGGLKLDKALKVFKMDIMHKIAMDVGASTGGFTDCMLKNGAQKVYAVDVGYGQLAWNLRNDERVVNLERTNIRHIDQNLIKEKIEFFSVDVSFISLCLVLPVVKSLVAEGASGVCLIKPQFEAGKEKVGKNGVVRDSKTHVEVINKITSFSNEIGLKVTNLDFSPIKGPKGNIEYLMLVKNTVSEPPAAVDVEVVVESSHRILSEGDCVASGACS